MKSHRNIYRVPLVTFVILALLTFKTTRAEPTFPPADFAKLDTFEAIQLEDADKLFAAKDYRGAFAAYRAFASEFTRSEALPYALLRNARCLHLLNRRNNAIQAYQEVVDFFPNAIPFAAAALYYQGLAHGENGNDDRKTAVWARMVQNDAYAAQPQSGTALTFLAEEMEKAGRHQEAADYQWRTAVHFRNTNHNAAAKARDAVILHYIQRKPNHEKLQQFFIEAGGFQHNHSQTDKPDEDPRYWSRVLDLALSTPTEDNQRAQVCAYWSAKMGNRFADNDELRKKYFDTILAHENDPKKWLERLLAQYKSQPATIDRVVQWTRWIGNDSETRDAFFTREAKPFLDAMPVGEKLKLIPALAGNNNNQLRTQAEQVFRSIGNQPMSDAELRDYGMLAGTFESEETVLRIFARISDPAAAAKARFDYHTQWNFRGNATHAEKALAEIPALRRSPELAGPGLAWTEAELLQTLGRHEAAIQAFRNANRQPDSTWRIIDCLVALSRHDDAIRSARELESLGKDIAPKAALRIANIHKGAGDKAREITQLRQILVRYPKTPESSQAHLRLEDYQVPLVGGESE